MKENQSKITLIKRDDTFDIIKGVCILLMVIGHCPVKTSLENVIFSFHMPVFFFIAGFFFKPYGLHRTVITGIRRLFVPFVAVFLFCFAVAHIFDIFGCFSNVIMSRVDYNDPIKSIFLMGRGLPVWFLVSLFWCRLLSIPISKVKKDVVMLVGVLFAAIVAANLYYYIKLPLVIIPSLSALGFYTVGRLLSTRNFFSNEKIKMYLPLLLGVWGICLSTGKRLNIVFSEYSGFYVLDLLGALGVFISLYFLVQNCKTKSITWIFLKWCGVNSLIILCVHSVELNFFDIDALRKKLLLIFWPYELYVTVALRLAFDLSVAYALTKCKIIKRYVFAQYD